RRHARHDDRADRRSRESACIARQCRRNRTGSGRAARRRSRSMKGKLERIAVLVSAGPHPASGAPRYSRNDAAALETGRQLAQRHGAKLDVLHAGDASNPALEEYLALGAERVEVLICGEHDDAVTALARRLQGYDLVLTGTRAEGAF